MNKTNLLKFADFLKGYKGEFGLNHYYLMPSILEKSGFKGKSREDWSRFSERIFGLYYYSKKWDWCFAYIWMKVDPSPIGCAARIKILVNEGVPKNYWEQMWGQEVLSYNVEDEILIKEIEKILK